MQLDYSTMTMIVCMRHCEYILEHRCLTFEPVELISPPSGQWDGTTLTKTQPRCRWPDDAHAFVLADFSHLLAALAEGEVPAHHAILQRKVQNMNM